MNENDLRKWLKTKFINMEVV